MVNKDYYNTGSQNNSLQASGIGRACITLYLATDLNVSLLDWWCRH